MLGWACLSLSLCVCVHYVFNNLNSLYSRKKIRYLGVFENKKYQELIDECKNIDIKRQDNNSSLDVEFNDENVNMKNSLIELMNSETI